MAQKLNNFDMVIFGATGDLAMRKLLPCLYQAHAAGLLHPQGRILGVSRSQLNTSDFLAKVEKDSKIHIKQHFTDELWQSFIQRIQYLTVDVNTPEHFQTLRQTVQSRSQTDNVIIYLSTAPKFFAPACKNLAEVGLNADNVRIVLEKPLGTDLPSSQQINADVAQYFKEEQIYRIDHYLGKESLQNVLPLRFGNVFLSRFGTRILSNRCKLPLPNNWAWKSAANFTTSQAHCAIWCKITSYKCCVLWQWSSPNL